MFQVSEDGALLDNTHEWCAEASGAADRQARGAAFDDCCSSCARSAAQDRRLPQRRRARRPRPGRPRAARAQSILSVLGVPMVVDGQVRGVIGLDAVPASAPGPTRTRP